MNAKFNGWVKHDVISYENALSWIRYKTFRLILGENVKTSTSYMHIPMNIAALYKNKALVICS